MFIITIVDESLIDYQQTRYIKAIEKYIDLYGDTDVEIYSAPGRSEVGGNHTDHQHGCVLAAAANLEKSTSTLTTTGFSTSLKSILIKLPTELAHWSIKPHGLPK